MPDSGSPRVVVVGAGFAGLAAVRALRGSGAEVTLVDQRAYSTFQPLLYQVATGGLNPGDVAYSAARFARRHRASFVRGTLHAVEDGKVALADGTRLPYDYLVVAAGVSTNHAGVPGAEAHSTPLYTRRDAVASRDRLMALLAGAGAPDRPDQPGTPGRRRLTVLVVGGGPTGVETAGALAELRAAGARAGVLGIDPQCVQIVLIERGPALLEANHPSLRRYASDQLARRGVEIRTGVAVRALTERAATLTDGTTLEVDLTFWTAGVTASPLVADWGLPQGRGGRIRVEPDLRVAGRERVFAAGDLSIDGRSALPQLAQPAIQTGRHAGRQIIRLMAGRPTQSFRYHDKGTAATIGRGAAVVELPLGVRLTGLPAWLGWMGLHVVMLLGNRNRLSTLLNLGWRYLARPAGGELVIGDLPDR